MTSVRFSAVCLTLALAIQGCNNSSLPEKTAGGYDTDALAKRISESMAQLSAEDRKLAEAQKFCPVGVVFDDSGKPIQGFLGQIGKPVKHMVQDQAVFIMCPSCTEEFQNDTDKYMQVLAKIKANQ